MSGGLKVVVQPGRVTIVPVAAKAPAAVRFAAVLASWPALETWEAGAYVERLEAFLGREAAPSEVDELLCGVSYILGQYRDLRRALIGEVAAVPIPVEGEGADLTFIALGSEHELAAWRETYEKALPGYRCGWAA